MTPESGASSAAVLRDALAALRPSLAAFFARRAGRDAVDDLLQETSLRIERLRGQYDPGRPPEPWIWRVARLCLFERLREPRPEPLERAEALAGGPGEAELERARREHEEVVWTAVRNLEDAPRSRLRTFVALHALESVPHARLATELGISESASKMRVSRGLEALARTIAAGRSALSPAKREAADAAWAWVRARGERAERTAILAVFARIPAGLRAALGLASAPLDEVELARLDERLRAAGWPYP